MTYQTGKGELRIDLAWRPTLKNWDESKTGMVETGYLLSYPDDGSPPKPSDFKAAPTDRGIYLEARVRFPKASASSVSLTEQRFYFDGFEFWRRTPTNGKQIHQRAADLRLTVEHLGCDRNPRRDRRARRVQRLSRAD